MPGLRGGARVHVTEFSPLIEVTPECNLRCSYCYYTDRMDEFPDFQPEYIDPDVVRAVYESGWQQLGDRPSITGGEPFLHPDIEEILRYLDDRGATPVVNSNLVPIREDQYDLLEDHVAQVNTSIDHVHAEQHDGQRGGFGAVIDTLEDLVERDVDVRVTCVLTRNNYADVGEIFDRLLELDVDGLFFQPAYVPHDDGDLAITDLPDADTHELLEALEPWAAEFDCERNLEIMADSLLNGGIPEERCVMGESRFVLYHDGRVQPCFDRPDLVAGNVTEHPPREVLDRVVERGATIRNEECFNASCVCFFE